MKLVADGNGMSINLNENVCENTEIAENANEKSCGGEVKWVKREMLTCKDRMQDDCSAQSMQQNNTGIASSPDIPPIT